MNFIKQSQNIKEGKDAMGEINSINSSSFKDRLNTGIILSAISLGLVVIDSPLLYNLAKLALGLIISGEIFKMIYKKTMFFEEVATVQFYFFMTIVLYLLTSAILSFLCYLTHGLFLPLFITGFILLLKQIYNGQFNTFRESIIAGVVTTIYVNGGLEGITHGIMAFDHLDMLAIIITTIATDIGGYMFGKTIGGPKIIPKISPNKTYAGTIGGIVFGVTLGQTVLILASRSFGIYNLTFLLMFAIAGQIGDLIESLFKRSMGAKDSGNILKGHGGVFDRFDSLIMVGYILSMYKYYFIYMDFQVPPKMLFTIFIRGI